MQWSGNQQKISEFALRGTRKHKMQKHVKSCKLNKTLPCLCVLGGGAMKFSKGREYEFCLCQKTLIWNCWSNLCTNWGGLGEKDPLPTSRSKELSLISCCRQGWKMLLLVHLLAEIAKANESCTGIGDDRICCRRGSNFQHDKLV